MNSIVLLLLLLCPCSVVIASWADKKLVCRFHYTLDDNGETSRKQSDDFPAHLCTHVIYELPITNETYFAYRNASSEVNRLRRKNPSLIVLYRWLYIFNMNVTDPDRARTSTFKITIDDAADYAKTNGFDGVDVVAWNPPFENSSELFSNFRTALDKRNLLFTVTMNIRQTQKYLSMLLNASEYVDQTHIQCYPRRFLVATTGVPAPLHRTMTDEQEDRQFINIKDLLENWRKFPKQKLILQFGFFGTSYKLLDSSNHHINAPVKMASSMRYRDICRIMTEEEGWTQEFDDDTKSRYAFNLGNTTKIEGRNWIGYEDVKSLSHKVHFVKESGYGGIGIASIQDDDVDGVCGDGKYPLLTKVYRELQEQQKQNQTTSTNDESWTEVFIYGATSVVALLAIIFGIVLFVVTRTIVMSKQISEIEEQLNTATPGKVYLPWQVTLCKEQLGGGNGGYVTRAVIRKYLLFKEDVAAKTPRSEGTKTKEEREKFLKEAQIMQEFHHKNVLSLIGTSVTAKSKVPLIIMELMENGSLLDYLRNNNNSIDLTRQLMFALDVAKGMEYLSMKEVVHRDLSARNCGVNGKLTVKVADFGLARKIGYVLSSTSTFHPKWTAPESLRCGPNAAATYKSDVWSYGVVLWEIMTKGQDPYPDIPDNADDMYHLLEGEGRLDPPEGCPADVYDVMRRCWRWNPEERPTFSDIITDFDRITDTMRYVPTIKDRGYKNLSEI